MLQRRSCTCTACIFGRGIRSVEEGYVIINDRAPRGGPGPNSIANIAHAIMNVNRPDPDGNRYRRTSTRAGRHWQLAIAISTILLCVYDRALGHYTIVNAATGQHYITLHDCIMPAKPPPAP